MSIQVLEKPGDLSGRIGRGIGKGLSEQLPKEVQRQRLAYGLKSLQDSQNQGQPLTPIDQISRLMQSGADLSDVQHLVPYLQQQGARTEAARKQQGQKQPQENVTQNQQAQQVNQNANNVPSQALETGHNPNRIINTRESIREKGSQLTQQNPYQFPTLDAGIAEAEKLALNQENNITDANKEFDNILGTLTQKGGQSYSDVLGIQKEAFRKKAEDAVINGEMSAKEAARKYGNEALNFAKSRSNLRTISPRAVFTNSQKDNRKNIDEVRKEYEKYGLADEFRNELIGDIHYSPGYATYLAYPPSSEVKKELSSTQNLSKIVHGFNKRESEAKLVDRISKNMTEKDNPLGIAWALNKKGYDPNIILDEFEKRYKDGKLRLNANQARDLTQKRSKMVPSFNDLLTSSFTGDF